MFNLSQTILSAHGGKEPSTLAFAHHQFNIVVKIVLGKPTKLRISMRNQSPRDIVFMERFIHNTSGVFLHQEEHVAYILISVESGKDLDVFNRIRGLQQEYPLGEIAMLYGDYDLIVKVRITKTDDLENFVFKGLRSISGITETKTLIAPRLIEFK